MKITYLSAALYTNLILVLLQKQIGELIPIYMIGSLALNVVILISMGRIKKLPGVYMLFLLGAVIGIINTIGMIGLQDGIKVIVRFAWFVTSILVCYSLLKRSCLCDFEALRRFFVFFAYLLIFDMLLSIFFYGNIHMPQEGMRTVLIGTSMSKYLSYAAIPFLMISGRKNWVLAAIIFIPILLGTRAGMLAGLFSVLAMTLVLVRERLGRNLLMRTGVVFVLFTTIFYASLQVVESTRTDNALDNNSSTLARVAIWTNYLSILKNYPFGTGPEGAFYLMKSNGFNADSEGAIALMKGVIDEHKLRHRFRILMNKQKAISDHSIHISFIVAYGIFGFILWAYLMFIMVKDVKHALFPKGNIQFSVIYIAFASVLIFGLFDSFHLGWFYLVLLYYSYIFFRENPMGQVQMPSKRGGNHWSP